MEEYFMKDSEEIVCPCCGTEEAYPGLEFCLQCIEDEGDPDPRDYFIDGKVLNGRNPDYKM
jgi:hypothetical protein